MRMWVFARRNLKELARDPLTLLFGLAFPLIVMLLLSAIQAHVPVEMFAISTLAPGIAVFGLSFVALLSGLLVAKDRCSSFLTRLFSSPMTAWDFILAYCLPMLLLAVAQNALCFGVAMLLGLTPSVSILYSLLALLPAMLLFTGIGLLTGSLFSDRQVGTFCGALLTNLTAWLSGVWFDYRLVGSVFTHVARALPFAHAVDAARAALYGSPADLWPALAVVSAYAVVFLALAVLAFRRQMRAR